MLTKKIAVMLLIVMVLTAFSGCVDLENYELKIPSPEADAYVEDFMASVESKNFDEFLVKYYGEDAPSEYDDTVQEVFSTIEGTMTRYRKVRFDSNSVTGGDGIKKTQIQYIYIIDTDKASYTLVVRATKQDDQVSIIGLDIHPGGTENFKDKRFTGHPLQIVLLMYSIICYGFIVYVIVKCLKSRVRLKPLWILSFIAQTGFQIEHIFSNGQETSTFLINFVNIGISSFTNYGEQGYIFKIVFPFIALIFLRSIDKLERKADAFRAKKSNAATIVDGPTETTGAPTEIMGEPTENK